MKTKRHEKIYKGYMIMLHNKEFMARETSGTEVLQAKTLKELTTKINKRVDKVK